MNGFESQSFFVIWTAQTVFMVNLLSTFQQFEISSFQGTYSTLISGSIILTQVVLPLVLSHYMGLASLVLKFVYRIKMEHVNLAACVLRYVSIKCFIASNGEYDVIAKEIEDPNNESLHRPEIRRDGKN